MTETTQHKSTRSDPQPTPESRLVYVFVHTPRTKDGAGKLKEFPSYEIGMVCIPKLHTDPQQCANYKFLEKHCMDAAVKQWGNFPEGGHWPIKDGDVLPKAKAPAPGQTPADPAIAAAKYAFRKGHWVIEVGSFATNKDGTPRVGPRVAVMQNGVPIEIPAQNVAGKSMYKSGDYGHVSIHAYTFHNKTWGVKFGFEGVLFTREGEAIGGSGGPRSAESMFAGIAPMNPPAGPRPPGVAPTMQAPAGPPAGYTAPPVYSPPAAPTAPMPGSPPAYAPPAAPVATAPPAAPVAPPPAPPLGTLPPFPAAR